MIAQSGILYAKNFGQSRTVEHLNGNSDVGQASEFPFKSSPKKIKPFYFLFFQKITPIIILLSLIGYTKGSFASSSAFQVKTQAFKTTFPLNNSVSLSQPARSFPTVLAATVSAKVIDETFRISIPKIKAEAQVFPNVDYTNEKDYMEALKKGVAHAQGTALPGEGKNIYLFAHSTDNINNIERYNAVFYYLRDLKTDDEVKVTFSGKDYLYKVSEIKIVEADATEYLDMGNGEEEILILQTCWPPGTRLKRLLVFAKREI